MKREMELVREILLRVEASDEALGSGEILIPDFKKNQIGKHCKWLVQAGFLEGLESGNLAATFPEYLGLDLTWQGLEFLETIRDPKIWAQTKTVLGKTGNWTATLLTDVAGQLALKIAQSFLP